MDDVNVRKAISHAIKYEEIIEHIEKKKAKRTYGIIPEGIQGYNPDPTLLYDFDLTKARELMKASKYPNGFTTNLNFAAERRHEFEQVATYIQAYLKKIDVNVKIQNMTLDAQIAKQGDGAYGMSLMTWTYNLPIIDGDVACLYDTTRTKSGWNGSFWDDKEVQDSITKAMGTDDADVRIKLFRGMDRKAVENAVYIYLYQLSNQIAMRENIQNLYFNGFMDIWFWDVEKK